MQTLHYFSIELCILLTCFTKNRLSENAFLHSMHTKSFPPVDCLDVTVQVRFNKIIKTALIAGKPLISQTYQSNVSLQVRF